MSDKIFIDTNRDRKTYYQLVVNTAGTTYDALCYDKTFEMNAKVAASKKDNSWTVEVAIPWENINTASPVENTKMGFALVRTRTQTDEMQQYPVFFGPNHQPEMFGDLAFKSEKKKN